MHKKKVILVTGPTASGKTALAIRLAQQYHTEIISADSRQCYRELNIGAAKPDAGQLLAVKHHFINSHSIHDEVNAAVFAQYAEEVATRLLKDHDVLIMAGGTGLYIKAFFEGLDEIPEVAADLREDLRRQYDNKGMDWLREEVSQRDPLFFKTGETANPQRMLRALEVVLTAGKSIREFQSAKKPGIKLDIDVEKLAIDLSRDELYRNINTRVDKMIEEGLEEEARELLPNLHLNALQTVGYTEMFDYFDGKYDRQTAIEKIKQHTRNYAKRQLTWFRRDAEIRWVKKA